MTLTTQHVEARSRRGRKIITFHGADASIAALAWDKDRRMLATLRNRAVTEVTFHLVTWHEELLNLKELA